MLYISHRKSEIGLEAQDLPELMAKKDEILNEDKLKVRLVFLVRIPGRALYVIKFSSIIAVPKASRAL